MVLIEPEQGIADQKVPHFRTAIVKEQSVPLRLLPLAGIGMFIQVGAVEVAKPVLVFGEMRGYPVENDSDAALMQIVHQIHEIGWSTEPAGRGKIASCLVPPGAVEGMFADGKKFDVGIT